MAKNLKLTIKNTQIAEAINLGNLKSKLASKKAPSAQETREPAPKKSAKPSASKAAKAEAAPEEVKEEHPRIRARSRSAFADPASSDQKHKSHVEEEQPEPSEPEVPEQVEEVQAEPVFPSAQTEPEEVTASIEKSEEPSSTAVEEAPSISPIQEPSPAVSEERPAAAPLAKEEPQKVRPKPTPSPAPKPPQFKQQPIFRSLPPRQAKPPITFEPPAVKLGPTGRHIKDLLPPKPAPKPRSEAPHSHTGAPKESFSSPSRHGPLKPPSEENRDRSKGKQKEEGAAEEQPKKAAKFKEFKDVKPTRRDTQKSFDGRDRQGLSAGDDERGWRKKRYKQARHVEDTTIRPSSLTVRIPIAIKDLASEMKLKASQLVQKLFLQGLVVTLNDILEDETTIQLLGHEFGCEITIDTSEEERIRITDKSIREEILSFPVEEQTMRAPVVAFMGHVDHGKTSLIDAIRKSNRVAGEAGAITQHIGAFRCSTAVGDIAILDTPGHEAFSAMRARGADVTDIVVLVVAGDEGIRQQTIEAIHHAKAAKVTIVVAINKADKPNFNPENVYRQLAEQDLLPESWGGQTITINCSAVSGEGIEQLLEMLALQAEVLELKAIPGTRARGSVLESEMHKGLGSVATILVQNGTLHKGDCLVFGSHWGRVKTMFNEHKQDLSEAGPSTPVEITGLSGLPEAGEEFIVVKNEKEAREISEARIMDQRQVNLLQKKKVTMESMLQSSDSGKKILNLVLRADVQGSLEALRAALLKIESEKAELNIIFTGVGEISESDVQLAAASKAVILGFHSQVESHADNLVKQLGVQVRLHDIIYHAIDDVKLLMSGLLDKIAQENEKGHAEVKAVFKSSQHGSIAGCQVLDGVIQRNNQVRLKRGDEIVWKGTISSLKRVKEDVREVAKGFECGILLNGWNDIHEGDIIEAYEIVYLSQEL